jgi:hypothetical protein
MCVMLDVGDAPIPEAVGGLDQLDQARQHILISIGIAAYRAKPRHLSGVSNCWINLKNHLLVMSPSLALFELD